MQRDRTYYVFDGILRSNAEAFHSHHEPSLCFLGDDGNGDCDGEPNFPFRPVAVPGKIYQYDRFFALAVPV